MPIHETFDLRDRYDDDREPDNFGLAEVLENKQLMVVDDGNAVHVQVQYDSWIDSRERENN